MDAWLIYFHCMYLSIVRYYVTAIPSGIAKISSFHEESLSDPNPPTAVIKSGIGAENLGLCLGLSSLKTRVVREDNIARRRQPYVNSNNK